MGLHPDASPMEADDLRDFARGCLRTHNPFQQHTGYSDRCEHCHYTRHPCDTFDLAAHLLALLDGGQ